MTALDSLDYTNLAELLACRAASTPKRTATVDDNDEPYLRTGDLGFLKEGALYICGRLKDLLIINGRNIYPQDVEMAAFPAHPKLRRDGAAAFGYEPSFTQQRLWFIDLLEPGSEQYNMPGAFRLLGHLDVQALQHSIKEEQ